MTSAEASARSDMRIYSLDRITDIRPPVGAPATTQSVAVGEDEILVLHDHSVIQSYDHTGFRRERRLRSGTLHHPNDCVWGDDILWVCDTGDSVPMIKKVDLALLEVVDTFDAQLDGWRIASIDLDGAGGMWCVAVQSLPVAERTTILVARLDLESRTLTPKFTLPTDQYYVQGCSAVERDLIIGVNNGNVRMSKLLRVDLDRSTIVETIVLDEFGESEGLDARMVDGRCEVYTAVIDGLFRVS